MRLDQYEWSRNPRGLHVQRILITPLDIKRWTTPHFGWVKLIASSDEYVDDSEEFMAQGVTPVLRPYRAKWGAKPIDRALQNQITAYARRGVKWFEFYNEPNLGVEWPDGVDPDWRDTANIIRPLMENWLTFAEFVISLGCYPGFLPLAESGDLKYATVPWMNSFLNYMAANRYDRFRSVLANGAWVSTHPYLYNHFYQEKPGGGPRSARAPEDERAQEPGWHFEYPYDPITQASDPGRTVYGGTAQTPNGDPNGLLAIGRMFNEQAGRLFGSQAVPVLGTEGGIWPFRGGPHQQDKRFPPYTETSQAEATVAMFEWITKVSPPWFFGVTLWKEDEYYDGGRAPAIDRLEQIQPLLRTVPAIEVMGSGYTPPGPEVTRGPGPIQGRADFHMIILAPGLDSRRFFETAQSYWNTFRPMVTTDLNLIDLIPPNKSLAVTVIATPDLVPMMTEQIKDKYPNVWFDLITATDFDSVRQTFNDRVIANRRFG